MLNIPVVRILVCTVVSFYASPIVMPPDSEKFTQSIDLLEKGLHQFLVIPCRLHVIKVLFGVHSRDSTILEKDMIKNTLFGYISKTDHVIV